MISDFNYLIKSSLFIFGSLVDVAPKFDEDSSILFYFWTVSSLFFRETCIYFKLSSIFYSDFSVLSGFPILDIDFDYFILLEGFALSVSIFNLTSPSKSLSLFECLATFFILNVYLF